jgi:hypothetical protein
MGRAGRFLGLGPPFCPISDKREAVGAPFWSLRPNTGTTSQKSVGLAQIFPVFSRQYSNGLTIGSIGRRPHFNDVVEVGAICFEKDQVKEVPRDE